MVTDPRNILLLSSVGNGGNAASVIDYLEGFAKHSIHNFYYHNFVYDFKADFDLSPFDAILISHNFWPQSLKPEQREAIGRSSALKVLFLQDEYQYVREINAHMAELNINLMFTLVAERDFETWYPQELIPSLREVHQVLAGYVPQRLTSPDLRGRGRRRYDIGYRSRVSPYFLGKFGREKHQIAEQFHQISRHYGFKANISVHEEDRLYGDNWIRFLQSCRTQLGTPSGSSIVDMDGSIIEAETAYRIAHPHAGFDEVWLNVLAPHEGKLVTETVSPRFFEYAATNTAMVLHAGHYCGVLESDKHYIPVAKDYSNVNDVIDKIRDTQYCESIANYAHAELIASGRFSLESFVRRFDAVLGRHLRAKTPRLPLDADAFYARQSEVHGQALAFSREGSRVLDTKDGRAIMRKRRLAAGFLRTPVIGRALRRVGGDPNSKMRKGSAALSIALRIVQFRSLVLALLRRRDLLSRVPLEHVAKDLLLLAICKGVQAGMAPWGPPHRIRLIHEPQAGRLILQGVSLPQPGEDNAVEDRPFDQWDEVLRQFEAQHIDMIAWDEALVFPLRKFANVTSFFWPVFGQLEIFRSAPDEYYHLRALTALSCSLPSEVAGVIKCALARPSHAEKRVLERVFLRQRH
jgi:hypothetical protein